MTPDPYCPAVYRPQANSLAALTYYLIRRCVMPPFEPGTAVYPQGWARWWAADAEPWLLIRAIWLCGTITALPGETLEQTQARAALNR